VRDLFLIRVHPCPSVVKTLNEHKNSFPFACAGRSDGRDENPRAGSRDVIWINSSGAGCRAFRRRRGAGGGFDGKVSLPGGGRQFARNSPAFNVPWKFSARLALTTPAAGENIVERTEIGCSGTGDARARAYQCQNPRCGAQTAEGGALIAKRATVWWPGWPGRLLADSNQNCDRPPPSLSVIYRQGGLVTQPLLKRNQNALPRARHLAEF